MITFSELNLLAVVVAALAGVVVGALWYSPVLFFNVWLKELGKTREELGGMLKPMLASMAVTLCESAAIKCLIVFLVVIRITGAIKLGLLVGAVLMSLTMLSDYMFEKRSMKIYLISAGNKTITAIVISIVLVLMK